MTISRRTESFRYTFDPVVPCLIRPVEMNGRPIESKQAAAELLDISPRGCKLDCPLNFRAQNNECKLVLNVQLAGSLTLPGTIIWQEARAHSFRYGVRFEDGVQQFVTEELKQFSRQKMQLTAESS